MEVVRLDLQPWTTRRQSNSLIGNMPVVFRVDNTVVIAEYIRGPEVLWNDTNEYEV